MSPLFRNSSELLTVSLTVLGVTVGGLEFLFGITFLSFADLRPEEFATTVVIIKQFDFLILHKVEMQQSLNIFTVNIFTLN